MKLDYVICTRYFHRWSLDSKTFRSLRDLPMYICKSLCRDLFNVDVIAYNSSDGRVVWSVCLLSCRLGFDSESGQTKDFKIGIHSFPA